jgi:hypothetical protein
MIAVATDKYDPFLPAAWHLAAYFDFRAEDFLFNQRR